MKKFLLLATIFLSVSMTQSFSQNDAEAGLGGSVTADTIVSGGVDTVTNYEVDSVVVEDETVVDETQEGGWLAENYGKLIAIVLALYEIVARVYPTVTNISLLSLLMKLIAAIVPNRKASEVRALAGDKAKLEDRHEVIT